MRKQKDSAEKTIRDIRRTCLFSMNDQHGDFKVTIIRLRSTAYPATAGAKLI